MGDIADMILDGLIDCETGELIDGNSPGYPRKMSDSDLPLPDVKPKKKRNRRRNKNKNKDEQSKS